MPPVTFGLFDWIDRGTEPSHDYGLGDRAERRHGGRLFGRPDLRRQDFTRPDNRPIRRCRLAGPSPIASRLIPPRAITVTSRPCLPPRHSHRLGLNQRLPVLIMAVRFTREEVLRTALSC
jgi:hypothetical protein